MRIDLVGTTADFRRFGPPRSLPINHLLCENCGTPGRIGEVGLVAAAGERAGMRFLEFFAANIRNPHTRRAYARAADEFLAWWQAPACLRSALSSRCTSPPGSRPRRASSRRRALSNGSPRSVTCSVGWCRTSGAGQPGCVGARAPARRDVRATPVLDPSERRRCAIYTRKSSEEGLEQEFNSLAAQREACEAYIRSQQHEGWLLARNRYDDGGFSGGNLERPAAQRLLGDIRAGRIDIVVVYKVDRLTRSLADFARLVELFDAEIGGARYRGIRFARDSALEEVDSTHRSLATSRGSRHGKW